jgi:hypothetical protein
MDYKSSGRDSSELAPCLEHLEKNSRETKEKEKKEPGGKQSTRLESY